MRYNFGIGDYSDDGHGKCDYYECEVEGDYSIAEIKEAYEKSREQLGFGLEDIASDYDSGMTDDQAQAIVDFGLQEPVEWDLNDITLAESIQQELDEEVWLLIFELMVQKHLPNFKAKVVSNNLPSLFGEWGSQIIKHCHIGYGMKGH